MKITSKSLVVMLTEESVKVGELETDISAQVFCAFEDGKILVEDIDFIDHTNTTFMKVPIDGYQNWKKFVTFHQSMGIDWNNILNNKFKEIFTDSSINEILETIKIN